MKKFFLILTTVCLMGSVWAEGFSLQGKKDDGGNTKLRVGIAMPLGDFASCDGTWVLQSTANIQNVAGYAKKGFNVGLQQNFPLLGPIDLFFSADLMFNQFHADSLLALNSGTETTPFSFNLPMMIGASLQLPLLGNLAVMAEAAIGLNFCYITKWEYEGDLMGIVGAGYSNRYRVANNVAYRLGAGLMLGKVLSIELQYLNLGSIGQNGTSHVSGNVLGLSGNTDLDIQTAKLQTNLVNLCLGYRF